MQRWLTAQTYKRIIQGWERYFFPDVKMEVTAYARAQICAGCEHAKDGRFEQLIKDELKEIQGMKCNACGCPLSAKLRSKDEACDLGKW